MTLQLLLLAGDSDGAVVDDHALQRMQHPLVLHNRQYLTLLRSPHTRRTVGLAEVRIRELRLQQGVFFLDNTHTWRPSTILVRRLNLLHPRAFDT